MEKTNNQRNFVICGHGGYGITGPFLYHPEVGAILHFATLAIIACADINQLHWRWWTFLGKANILELHCSLTKIWKLFKFPITNICRKQGPAANDASSWILGHILLSEYGNSLTFGGRYARELFWCYSWLCRPSWSFLYIKFSISCVFLQKRDIPTDGRTDGRTHPLIEMRGRI